ncbi:MAG: FKBP-type peptidyl-prolyl cis-trans isomerase [Nanoarchaeota archaeon]
MEKVGKGDFIEIDFVGRIKNGPIFDLTREDVAKENNLYREDISYKPLVICVGERNVIPGLDDELIGKEIGKEYTVEVNHERAFGKKDLRLMKLVNINLFRKNKIDPVQGLQVNIDNLIGVVRSVAGGRVIVDFNNPLAGRDLVYEVRVNKRIKDVVEKVKSCMQFILGLSDKLYTIKRDKNKIEITTKIEIPKDVEEKFIEHTKREIKDALEIIFKHEQKDAIKNDIEKKKDIGE